MNKLAHISGIAFSLIFGFSFMMSKTALNQISPIGLLAYRFLIAFGVFEILRFSNIIKIKIHKKALFSIVLVAVFQPVLYFLFEVYGLAITASGEAGLMIALIPIFVTIFSALILKEKPSKLQLLFITISFCGVILIQFFKTRFAFESSLLGFSLLLLAVISASLFNIASRKAAQNHKPHEITYMMMLIGALVFNFIYLIELALNENIKYYFTNFANLSLMLPIIYLGTIASILGFFLVNYSLKHLPAHVSSVYSNIATIVAVIAGALFLNETVEFYHIFGGFMIITGVYGAARINYLKYRRNRIDQSNQILSQTD